MDNLVLLLLLGDFCDNLSFFLGAFPLTLLSMYAIAAATIGLHCFGEHEMPRAKALWLKTRKIPIILSIFLFLGVLIPAKETVYLIAGIQASKDAISQVSNSDIGQKTLKLLEQRLDEVLADTKKVEKE